MDSDRLLPPAPPPQGDYVPATMAAGLAFSAGMTPRRDGVLVVTGRVGAEIDLETARGAAGLAAENALAALADTAGGLTAIARAIHLTVYVAAVPGFGAHSAIADGASAALVAALGDAGLASRVAVGVDSLPGGAPVEVQLCVALRAPAS